MAIYHIFFISQKQTFNVSGTDYDAWVINYDGQDYYFMEATDPRPESPTVRTVVDVIASSGGNDVIYYVTRKLSEATAISNAAEFAGGSATDTADAYLSLSLLSYKQKGAHASFPLGAVADLVLRCQWNGGSGNVNVWEAAGYPLDQLRVTKPVKVSGIA